MDMSSSKEDPETKDGFSLIDDFVEFLNRSLSPWIAIAGLIMIFTGAFLITGASAGLLAVYGVGAVVLGILIYSSIWVLKLI